MSEEKKLIRSRMAQLKRGCTAAQRGALSELLMQRVEVHPRFLSAEVVLLYHSLPDEVDTHAFIERWSGRKQLILPVVKEDFQLELRRYTGPQDLCTGAFGIREPVGAPFTDYPAIDLALIPGVAFDVYGNRLGRGKGYYDRLLPRLTAAYKLGVCFPFQQLQEALPTEPTDIPMDEVLTLSPVSGT